MSRFAIAPQVAVRAPFSIGISPAPTTTFEGGAGYLPSDPHVELWNAAVSGMLADQFYESGDSRVARLMYLVPLCDPTWLQGFIPWLRDEAGLRSASVVLAAEYAFAKFPHARRIVASALKRADEPGEMLGYWFSRHSRALPAAVKRGVADACVQLYTERSTLRYDGTGKAWRFGDVLEVVHPKPKDATQSALFRFLLDRRRHDVTADPALLPRLNYTLGLDLMESRALEVVIGNPLLEMSWERASSWLGRPLTASEWEMLVPTMGYLAVVRNLNNFDRAGVNASAVTPILTDPAKILDSKVMPFRFLTAYKSLEADTYRLPLAHAADLALGNLPAFGGHTLIMVDRSGSMADPVGAGKSRLPLRLSELAAFFAEALARRCAQVTVCTYDNNVEQVPILPHTSVLTGASREFYTPRGGTDTWRTTQYVHNLVHPDRIIIITDEQSSSGDDGSIRVPVITWNLAGYQAHHAAHGAHNRFLVAGYSDTALQTLPAVIARGGTGRWPWQ